MIPDTILNYFDKMKPGDKIDIWKVRSPLQLIWAAQGYIENGGDLEISNDYSMIKKIHPYG